MRSFQTTRKIGTVGVAAMARECAMASCKDTGACSPSTNSQSNPDQPSASVALTELSIDQMPISGRPPLSAARNGLGGRLRGSGCVKIISQDYFQDHFQDHFQDNFL